MKQKLSPEASGTLAALRDLHKIKSFSPDCAEELSSGGFALRKGRHLVITDKGLRKAGKLYAEVSSAPAADTPEP